MTEYDAKFWKAEYERLRRNKNKEIQRMRERQSIFFDKTWKLLTKHYTFEELMSLYKEEECQH